MSIASPLRSIIHGFTVSRRTIFARLCDVYPECEALIEDSPQLHQLFCFRPGSMCHKNASCFDKLAKRVIALYEALHPIYPKTRGIILYWRWRHRRHPSELGTYRGIGGARIDCSFKKPPFLLNPRHGYVLNPGGWKRLVELGECWEWRVPEELRVPEPPKLIHGDAALVAMNEIKMPAARAHVLQTIEVRGS